MILNKLDNDSNIVDSMFEVVHEIKNSFAVCSGYLDIIDNKKYDDLREYVLIIKNEVNRSVGIINEFMLDKKISLRKDIIDINLFLKDLCNDMEGFIKSYNILFDFEISDDDVYICGDYNKLKQVFINFIKNSIESIEVSMGKITLSSFVMKDYFCIVIKDNGSGMDEEMLSKIKFGNLTTKENGNGIGVKFCNRIIEEHGGSLSYNSIIGVGTEVIVKLPVVML